MKKNQGFTDEEIYILQSNPYTFNVSRKRFALTLAGKELVAFETAYRLEGYKKGDDVSKTPGVIVAEHKDLKDKGQTIKVVKPGTPIEHSPKTGDDAQVLVAAALMLAAAAFAYALYKRRKTGKEDSEETEE